MEEPRILSGDALVAKGITKIDASLPEVGLKDVAPNGSWLEQKQIQAALEARKYLVEVERIEKCGTLSHAEWRDDLMLAEVTQKTGGYWQYLGHNVGKTLYLRPEEALFLMEVNCLLLKHNEVTVSLQKAYSLLLHSSTTITQYKVYASLSRLGYRVFRHTQPKVDDTKKNESDKKQEIKNIDQESVSMDVTSKNVDSPTAATIKSEVVDAPIASMRNEPKTDDFSIIRAEKETESADLSIVSTVSNSENVSLPVVTISNVQISTPSECEKAQSDAPIENTVGDLKTDNILVVETVTDSEMIETVTDSEMTETVTDSEMTEIPKDDVPIENLENRESFIESRANQVNEQEHIPDQQIDKGSERNGSIVEMVEVKDSKQIAEQLDAENGVAKENSLTTLLLSESPNVMEVNDFAESKTAENKIENTEEISSTIAENKKKYENEIDSMEICNKNQEADVVLMEENYDTSKDVQMSSTEVSTTIAKISDTPIDLVEVVEDADAASATNLENIKTRDTVFQTNGDSAKRLEVPNNNDPSVANKCTATENQIAQNNYYNKDGNSYNYLAKIEKLTKRQLKHSDSKSIERYFENFPDFSRGFVVTINVPEQQFIPKNIFVNKATYTLNLQNIVMRTTRSASSESPTYTCSDEVNGTNIRRIRSTSEVLSTHFPQNQNFITQGRYPNNNLFRPYGLWGPQNNLNFCQLLFFPSHQYHQWPARPPFYSIHRNISNNARKRIRSGKSAHFQGIKNLAVRLRQSLISGNTDMGNLESLHGLIHSYNLKYKTRLRITAHFDVINEEKIVETIELDDDEESKSKKPRLEKDDDDKFDENLYRLRQLALRLRDLEAKDEATASHRRAFSKAIKTFNKSYNADVYLDGDSYEVIDRRCITLDSSSESDCVVEEQVKVRSKKLRNPFNILKRRKERQQSLNKPGTSKEVNTSDHNKTDPDRTPTEADGDNNKYSELIQTFNKAWLPNEEDFGRAEIVPKRSMSSRLEITNKELFLYDYMKDHLQPYKNWLEAKLSFLGYLEETNIAFKNQQAQILADAELGNTGLKPLIDFEDSSDMPTLLKKLRIIENNKEIDTETSLRIDFDVYNRNVQNFRKRNPPKPHFRIICMDESSSFPPAAHVMSLHSKYEDNVPVVFAIVSTGSISYLQINPIDLPIYVPNSDGE